MSEVADVRRFNRTITQRVGALDDEYLARGRPLGASRVLWEIGVEGCEVRMLRSRLGLDSGHLSRLLRVLEAEGLVTVAPSSVDRRLRVARLTVAGVAEHAVLDERSDALAGAMLASVDPARRDDLVAAMRTVERLLTAADVEVAVADPAGDAARACLRAYFAELDRRGEHGFDPAAAISAEPHELRLPAGAFLLATLRGEAVGCGALKLHGDAALRDQADVGGGVGARAGPGAPAAGRAGGARGRRMGRASRASRPTMCSSRRWLCIARPATSRCPRSTPSRSPITGSRSGWTRRRAAGRISGQLEQLEHRVPVARGGDTRQLLARSLAAGDFWMPFTCHT